MTWILVRWTILFKPTLQRTFGRLFIDLSAGCDILTLSSCLLIVKTLKKVTNIKLWSQTCEILTLKANILLIFKADMIMTLKYFCCFSLQNVSFKMLEFYFTPKTVGHHLQSFCVTKCVLKLNVMQLVPPGVNHCCLMAIVYGPM